MYFSYYFYFRNVNIKIKPLIMVTIVLYPYVVECTIGSGYMDVPTPW